MPDKCPYCDFEANDVQEEIDHMNAKHPEIIRERLEKAGMPESEPSPLAKARAEGTSGPSMEQLRDALLRRGEPTGVETLMRLIRHGIEALRDGDGDSMTARATLANLDQLERLVVEQRSHIGRADAREQRVTKLEVENKRLRELYENVVNNRERFGWTINHLLECEEALSEVEGALAGLQEAIHRVNVDWDEVARSCGDPKCNGDCRWVRVLRENGAL